MYQSVSAGQIEAVHAHLAAGHEVAIVTYGRTTLLDRRHLDYIRSSADGKGYLLGWPGRRADYCFPEYIKLVAPGHTLKPRRRRK